MLKPIQHINAIKILDEYKTKGSGPLKVIGEDDSLYVAKFTDQNHPFLELINEVVCGYLAQSWELKAPDMAIISIPEDVNSEFLFSNRYKSSSFNNLFYGSKLIESAIDFSFYIREVNSKSKYQEFKNGLDLLKIGCFDYWIGNKDRNPKNPNIIISIDSYNKKYNFHPLDHTAAFAYLPYSEVRDVMLDLSKSILQSSFVRSICQWEDKEKLESLKYNIELCIQN